MHYVSHFVADLGSPTLQGPLGAISVSPAAPLSQAPLDLSCWVEPANAYRPGPQLNH